MTLALIVRADNGGLGAQTLEAHRHLKPDVTVLVDLKDKGRGECHRDRYPGAIVHEGWGIDGRALKALQSCETVFTCEVPYRDDMHEQLAKSGTRLIVQGNAELIHAWMSADVWTFPTHWNPCGTLPVGDVLPVPVARDRLPFRLRTSMATVMHPCAPATGDRNGTELFIDSLRLVRSPLNVVFTGADVAEHQVMRARIPRRHEVEFRGPYVNYFEQYTDDIDVLVLPRRYGGLSLPLQESASCGIVPIMLDVEPQRRWLPFTSLVSPGASVMLKLPGGRVPSAQGDDQALAERLDLLANNPSMVAGASRMVGDWAGGRSWDALLPAYRALLS